MKNYLICWEENGVKKWDMLKEKDSNDFLMNLMQTSDVKKRSIFIVPCIGFVSGIWLFPETHKGNRVDFWNFFEDYDMTYQPPEIKPENRTILHEVHERRNTDLSRQKGVIFTVDTRAIAHWQITFALAW